MTLMGLCPNFPLLRNTPAIGPRGPLNPIGPQFKLILSTKTLSPSKVTFTGVQKWGEGHSTGPQASTQTCGPRAVSPPPRLAQLQAAGGWPPQGASAIRTRQRQRWPAPAPPGQRCPSQDTGPSPRLQVALSRAVFPLSPHPTRLVVWLRTTVLLSLVPSLASDPRWNSCRASGSTTLGVRGTWCRVPVLSVPGSGARAFRDSKS